MVPYLLDKEEANEGQRVTRLVHGNARVSAAQTEGFNVSGAPSLAY